ncbi:hypothetical protein LCGC14_0768590 [marine sediment metagenome]|uniref:Uncharacterized protein n=1 Tax=marine sediment metagenome TaxID=412755 RepID=A0A0F9SJ18_9ZZZZ
MMLLGAGVAQLVSALVAKERGVLPAFAFVYDYYAITTHRRPPLCNHHWDGVQRADGALEAPTAPPRNADEVIGNWHSALPCK